MVSKKILNGIQKDTKLFDEKPFKAFADKGLKQKTVVFLSNNLFYFTFGKLWTLPSGKKKFTKVIGTSCQTGLNAVLRATPYLLHREPNQMTATLFDLNLDACLSIEQGND